MSNRAYFSELIYKFIRGTLTEQENSALMQMLENGENDPDLDAIMLESFRQSGDEAFWNEQYRDMFTSRILKADGFSRSPVDIKPVRRVHFLRPGFLRYAVAIILVIGVAAVALVVSPDRKPGSAGTTAQLSTPKSDISPGGNHAVLTLADGRAIVLDSVANGQLADQGEVKIVKLANGQIAYDLHGLSAKEVMWNTMTTPKGGQYQVTLPDGTKVWLNASSSITFPTAFTGAVRKVKVEGELYFEVADNKQKPFVVDVGSKSLIEVLGTSFNVNSYVDEGSIKTTLLEGSVKVNNSVVLKPGQQAIQKDPAGMAVSADKPNSHETVGKQDIVVSEANLDQALAWKNGIFDFTGADLKTVMRQLERWYDIKVQYKGPMSNMTFGGRMYRNVHLSDVLEALQKMGVKTELDGKNLMVF